ncbi:MAG: glycoside hydrolase family 28 protein [Candidatus Hydrogenedentes bacterium]|nr:glycoside hydrolase family 28 protein [Candidatus Hydrogenedentota bacterium]
MPRKINLSHSLLPILMYLFCISPIKSLEFPHSYVSIVDFGAVGDGKKVNTNAIQSTIDKVSEDGGGMVLIPRGTYLTGTVVLKSNVIIYLLPGSTLLGSANIEDYPEIKVGYRSYTDNYSQRSLIFAEKQHNIGIIGTGKIYGNGEHFREDESKIYKARPYLVRLVECEDVKLEGVTFENGAMWTVHLLACKDVICSKIKINSRCNRNNDGIDIDSSENVAVNDCNIVSGDDSIVLKSTSPKPCKNITITNCILSSWCNAIKMGTESNGGFQNITISNCTIYDTNLSGLALETVDGGITENINITNISMKNVNNPLFIRLGNRARPCCPDHKVESPGKMRNINISNITATGGDEIGCAIAGIPKHYIENVNLTNLTFYLKGSVQEKKEFPPENEEKYPEYKMFGILPAYGFFIRHVKGINFSDVKILTENLDVRPAIVLSDGLEVEFKNIKTNDIEGNLIEPIVEKN